MCIIISKELAIVSALNFLFCNKRNLDKNSTDVKLSVDMIFDYCYWLNSSNCGVIIKDFDREELLTFLEKSKFFKQCNNKLFAIKLPYEIYVNADGELLINDIQKFLINAFNPNMNHPRRFIEFLGFN